MKYLDILNDRNKTCIIFYGKDIVFESEKRGVQPLIDFLSKHKKQKRHYVLADKIIGKGAVILAKLICITEIHTPIISMDAQNLCIQYGIKVFSVSQVDYIKNRTNTGRCPIESCVLDIDEPFIGYEAIIKTLDNLKKAT